MPPHGASQARVSFDFTFFFSCEDMLPRRAARPRHLTLMPLSAFESRAERVRRLRTDLVHDDDDDDDDDDGHPLSG